MNAEEAVANAIAWFEVNSGWAPPDGDELAEWIADGVCRCPDDCLVIPDGWCDHGLASWALVLAALEESDRATRWSQPSDPVERERRLRQRLHREAEQQEG